jgi:hypothetical protein
VCLKLSSKGRADLQAEHTAEQGGKKERKYLALVSVELRDGHAVDDGQHERLLLSRGSEACAGGWSGGEPENLAVLQAGGG